MNRAGATRCDDCGKAFPRDTRAMKQVDGELAEVDDSEAKAAQAQAAREQGITKTMAGLVELGRLRGLKNPEGWAWHVWNSRKGRRTTA